MSENHGNGRSFRRSSGPSSPRAPRDNTSGLMDSHREGTSLTGAPSTSARALSALRSIVGTGLDEDTLRRYNPLVDNMSRRLSEASSSTLSAYRAERNDHLLPVTNRAGETFARTRETGENVSVHLDEPWSEAGDTQRVRGEGRARYVDGENTEARDRGDWAEGGAGYGWADPSLGRSLEDGMVHVSLEDLSDVEEEEQQTRNEISSESEDSDGSSVDEGGPINGGPPQGDRESEAIAAILETGLNSLVKWGEKSFPFLLLLLLLFLWTHIFGILMFVWHSIVLLQVDQFLRTYIAEKQNRKSTHLLAVIILSSVQVTWFYLNYAGEHIWNYLVFLPVHLPLEFWNCVWIIVTNDLMIRFIVIGVKGIVMLLSGGFSNQSRQKRFFTLLESWSQLYREVLPASVWIRFYLAVQGGESGTTMGYLLAMMYSIFKVKSLQSVLQYCHAVTISAVWNDTPYGSYATAEELEKAGTTCSICQDKLSAPVRLHCSHIYCEDCISSWFQAERTCPLCRAVIENAGRQPHGDGSTNLATQLF